jgi:hypothetical protein
VNTLRDDIVDAVASVQDELLIRELEMDGTRAQNELLFFFKPECFLQNTRSQQADLADVALRQFQSFGATVAGCVAMSGKTIRDRAVMDRHYGYINKLSRGASASLSIDEIAAIHKGTDSRTDTPIVGGHEFLSQNTRYDECSLEALWATKKSMKLKSGLYFQSYSIEGKELVLVNGFHPAQLAHFTTDGRRIVLVLLRSNLPWRVLRGVMLGDTFPERAVPGSFRRILFDDPKRFGLVSVSIANNGSHLSAGPFEALYEMWNFLSQSGVAKFNAENTRIWELMREARIDPARAHAALENPTISLGSVKKSLFDFTEELDALSSAHLYARS